MEDIKILLGRRLRYLRNRQGLTQEQLGEKASKKEYKTIYRVIEAILK